MRNEVVNYDGYDYDYSQYWTNRAYENNAEHLVLNRFLKDKKGNWFIDIGGSYGRLADCYTNKYTNCVILDYSLKTLKKNHELITNKYPNTTLIAANAYHMPFKDDVFDGGLMVRVLHHINRQKEYFTELSRILKDDSEYIQEFANKIHLKTQIKAILKGDKEILSKEPYQQPAINLEGAKDDGVSFLNYHPTFIEELFEECGFEIEEKQGCSYLRIPLLKRFLGTNILTSFEKLLQKALAKTNIPPSIFYKTELEKDIESDTTYKNILEILICPSCHGHLSFGENKAICDNCHKEYIKDGNVWDFRID